MNSLIIYLICFVSFYLIVSLTLGLCEFFPRRKWYSLKESLWDTFSDKEAHYLVLFLASILSGLSIIADAIACQLKQNDHIKQPCDQCAYRKVEKVFYNKNHEEFVEVEYVWDHCPELK